MRFKQFLESFILRDGDVRYIYTGNLDHDALYNGVRAIWYNDHHGWMDLYLESGTKVEFKHMYSLYDHHAEFMDYADMHNAPWLYHEVAVIRVHNDESLEGFDVYIQPRDLEKKTVDEETFKKIKLDWLKSLKEARKPKKVLIVPKPNTTYVIWGDPPEIYDCAVVTKTPTQPKHGETIPDGFFINIPNGEKIVFKHKVTNEHGTFAVIEWKGETYYHVWWMFPAHIKTPEQHRADQIKWLKSLKEGWGFFDPKDEEIEFKVGQKLFIWYKTQGDQSAFDCRINGELDHVFIDGGTEIRITHIDHLVDFTAKGFPGTFMCYPSELQECVVTPERMKEINRKWMNSLKEAEGDPAKYSGEQELIIDGDPFFDELWGYEDAPPATRDAKQFPNGTKVIFQNYETFNFTPHKERIAARVLIDGKEWLFKQEQFDQCTASPAEYRLKKLDWLHSLKESTEFNPGDVRVVYDPDETTYTAPRIFYHVSNPKFPVKKIMETEDWYGPGFSCITAENGMKLTLVERFEDERDGIPACWIITFDRAGKKIPWNGWISEENLHYGTVTPERLRELQKSFLKSLIDPDSK